MKQLKITAQITNRDSLSLDKYLNDISKEPMVTAEEEVELSKKIQAGDMEALEQLTRANLRFVVSVAKQYQNQGLPLIDLINEGNIGLIKAAQRFDPSKGFKFISYAVWWIRQSIMQGIVDQARLIRLPINKAAASHKIYKESVKFEQEHERSPYSNELSEIMDMKDKTIRDLLLSQARPVSMDAPVMEGEDLMLTDILTNADDKLPEEDLMYESLVKELNAMMDRLSPREADVLRCYFGLGGEERMTLTEIGERYGLTRERVRQIKERALRRMRKASLAKTLAAYLE